MLPVEIPSDLRMTDDMLHVPKIGETPNVNSALSTFQQRSAKHSTTQDDAA